jgi:hypothetical protein
MDAATALPTATPRRRLDWRVTAVQLTIGLTALALALRLVGLGIRPLWLDEAYSAWFSARGWHELWAVVPTYETHPPFYYSLLKLWRGTFGASAVALRVPSVLFGVATVPVVIAAALQLERIRPTGRPLLFCGTAALLAACAPTLIQHSQEARPYALMVFAYAVATLGLLRLTEEFSRGGAGGRISWLMLGAGTELTLWAHSLGPLYALCLAVALAPVWLRQLTKARFARGLLTAAVVAVLYLPCFLLVARRTGDWGNGWLTWRADHLLKLLGLYAVPAEVLTFVSAVAALIIILLTKRAIQSAVQQRSWSAEAALLLLWWGPPILTVLVSILYMPLFLPRTLTPTLVPCYLSLGAALARIPAARERLILAAALAASLVPAGLAMALRPATEPWDEVNHYIEQHIGPGDLVWLYPNDSGLPLRQAGPAATYKRRGIPADYPALGVPGPVRAGSPAVVSLTAPNAVRLADETARENIPAIWLLTVHNDYFDPSADVPAALSRTRRRGLRREWGYIAVQPFYLGAGKPARHSNARQN